MALKKYEDDERIVVWKPKETAAKQQQAVKQEETVDTTPAWITKLREGENVGYVGGVDIGSTSGAVNAGAGGLTDAAGGAAGADGEKSEWEKYKEQYIADQTAMYRDYGRRAMQDTVGEISARTGGLASSYAGIVGQETYDNYMQELAAKYPDLVAAALEMYNLEYPKSSGTTIKGSSGSYKASSDSTTPETTTKKQTVTKGEEEEETKTDSGYYYGFTEQDEVDGISGRNPYWVDRAYSTVAEKEANNQDAAWRASPLYSQIVDPYYASTVPSMAKTTEEEEKSKVAKWLQDLLYGE